MCTKSFTSTSVVYCLIILPPSLPSLASSPHLTTAPPPAVPLPDDDVPPPPPAIGLFKLPVDNSYLEEGDGESYATKEVGTEGGGREREGGREGGRPSSSGEEVEEILRKPRARS